MNLHKQLHTISMQGADYSDLFGKGKGYKRRLEKKAEKAVIKAKGKGDAERARLGLDTMPEPAATQEAATAAPKSKILLFAGIGAAVVILVITIIMLRK